MIYYDLSAKVFHKFSSTDMLSCNFYLGRDIAGSNGRETSARHSDNENIYSHVSEYDVTNYWGNLVSGLNWRHIFNERLSAKIMLNFSRYHYNYTVESTQKSSVTILNPSIVKNATFIESSVRYLSGIRDISLNYDLIYTPSGKHNIMAGAQYSNQFFTPTVHTYRYTKSSVMEVVTENLRDTTLGNVSVLNNFALYAEDEFVIMKSVKVNAGLRLNGYSVNGKIYLIPEPRMSMRLLLGKNLSLKGAYSKMSQGIHLLSSSNLVMPSDIWVPATGSIKPMISNQYSAGVFYDTKTLVSTKS
jgi:outer membrane receptor for ferrienterochelin and colicin